MSLGKQLTLFVIALLLFAVSLTPVSFISKYVTLPSNIAFQSLQGTIWSGRVDALQVDKLVIRNLTWDMRGWKIFTGKLSYDIKAGNARDILAISGKGNIQVGLESLYLDKLTLRAPADLIRPMLPIPVGKVGGRAIVEIADYQALRSAFDQGSELPLCDVLNGELVWTKSEIQIGQAIPLGTFAALMNCTEGEITMTFDGDNRLGLSGQGRLAKSRSVHFDGFVKPDSTLPRSISNGIAMFGKRDDQGRYIIKL